MGQTASLFGTIWYIRRPDSMNVLILCGGLDTRLAEETELRPKPMSEIGGWHIMKHYAPYDVKDFYLAPGHRGEIIKRLFIDYSGLGWSRKLDLTTRKTDKHDRACRDPFAMQ